MLHAVKPSLLAALLFAGQAYAQAPAAGAAAPDATKANGVSGSSQETVIQSVAVEGTQRVEPDTVRAYMLLHAGDTYSAQLADRSLKTLFDTGLFDDVRLSWDGSTLTVRVVENPIINQVVFEGNSKLTTESLTKEVQIKPRNVFTRAKVTEDVQRIIELYRRSGKFGATVEPKIIQRPQNRVDVVFEIKEGTTTGIARIDFVGNKSFNDSDLRGQILTEESAWWRFLSTNDNYDPDRLTFDREQLRRFYLNNGYADFRVVSAVAELTPDRQNFFITFTLDEGQQYKFGKVTVDSQIKDLDSAKLMPLLLTHEGEVYNSKQMDDSVEALTYAAGTQGFAFTDITPRIQRHPDTGVIDVEYRIAAAPRVYVEKINIVGNTVTRDEVIRREIGLAEGDAFNRVLMDRSRTRIRALGFFKKVDITQDPGSAQDRAVVNVKVEEQSTGSVSVGLGYSTQNSLTAEFSYTQTNLFGRGQYLGVGISTSSYQNNYNFRFVQPNFMDLPLSAGFQLYRVDTDYTSYAGYKSTTSAAGLLFGFPLSVYGHLAPRYTFRTDKLTVSDTASVSKYVETGTKSTSLAGYTYSYDTRDDTVKPTKGYVFQFDQDFAGLGGDLKYIRTETNIRYWHDTFSPRWVGSLSLSTGYIFGWGGQNVRINERFFKGGETFRGFDTAGLGPRDTANGVNTALGGQFYAVGSAGLRLPDWLPEDYGISMSLFSDFGTVGIVNGVSKTCTTDACVRDKMSLRASAGLSIAWKSPFGPVAIDLGFPFLKESYDKTQIFRFSAGTQF
jgi:outer membrane protein insertion porin family